MLSACGSGSSEEATTESAPTAEAPQEAVPVQAEAESEQLEPCFTVSEVGRMTLSWDLIVAARDASDQPEYFEGMTDTSSEMVSEVEDESCAGADEITRLSHEVGLLESDVEDGVDSDERYETIAELGNELLEVSDDEGYESFISDVSELDY